PADGPSASNSASRPREGGERATSSSSWTPPRDRRRVAARSGDPLDRLVHAILEAQALPGAHRLDLGDHAIGLVILAELDDLTGQSVDALAKRLLPGLLAGAQIAERPNDRALEIGQRISTVLRRELLHQRDPLLLQRVAQELGD